MGFSDKLAAGPPTNGPGLCKIGRFMADLPEGEREALEKMLDRNSGWADTAIAEALRDEGFLVVRSTIAHHRLLRCVCVSTG